MFIAINIKRKSVIEYNRHFSVLNCHLEDYYIVDRLLSDDSIVCDNLNKGCQQTSKSRFYTVWQFKTKGFNFFKKKTLYLQFTNFQRIRIWSLPKGAQFKFGFMFYMYVPNHQIYRCDKRLPFFKKGSKKGTIKKCSNYSDSRMPKP